MACTAPRLSSFVFNLDMCFVVAPFIFTPGWLFTFSTMLGQSLLLETGMSKCVFRIQASYCVEMPHQYSHYTVNRSSRQAGRQAGQSGRSHKKDSQEGNDIGQH